jgi:hypothetical protein
MIKATWRIATIAALPGCILFVDLDPLGSDRGLLADAGAADATVADAPPDATADARFCSGHAGAAVCEDFDRGKDNPALFWLDELGPTGGEMRIVRDAAKSPPGSLLVSIVKNDSPNIQHWLVVTPPRSGTRTALHFEIRPVGTDFVFFAVVECQQDDGAYNGLRLALTPEAAVDLTHDYDKEGRRVGNLRIDSFTAFDLTMTINGGRMKGEAKLAGQAGLPFDRPVACASSGVQRLLLGIEGAGGRATIGFDDLVYDVAP